MSNTEPTTSKSDCSSRCDLINQINAGTEDESWYCRTHSRPYYPNRKPTTSDMTVSEILAAVWNQGRSHTSQHSAVTEALAAIEAHYAAIRKADMEYVIGEDRPYSKLEKCPRCGDYQYSCYCSHAEEALQNEQRQRMAERLNNTEEQV